MSRRHKLALRALKHALDRLNAIPHRYADTDFRLIEGAIAELKTWRSPAALVVVKGGMAEILEQEPTCIRIVDLDNIKAGDPPVDLPAGIGFEELVKKAGLGEGADTPHSERFAPLINAGFGGEAVFRSALA